MKQTHLFFVCCALALQLGAQQQSPAQRLVRMAANGDLAGVRSLLSAGVDPNAVDNSEARGWTALMAAAKNGSAAVATELIRAHADVNALNEYGATALDVAEINLHPKVASVIRSAGGTGRPKAPVLPVPHCTTSTAPRPRPRTSQTSGESIAHVKAAIQEPRIALHYPGLECVANVKNLDRDYQVTRGWPGQDMGTVKLTGEFVDITLRQGGTIHELGTWGPRLPFGFDEKDWPSSSYMPANVRAEDLFVRLLHASVFTHEDLAELAFSKSVEVRIGAAANLDDTALLARIANSDEHPLAREIAVKRITDQAALARVANNDASPIVREAAVWRLEDQEALARMASSDGDGDIRSSAAVRLLELRSAWRTKTNPKDGLIYVWIAPGSFYSGCSPGDSECKPDEEPARQVNITKGFWLGQTAVTQQAYHRVTGEDPSYFQGANLPVEESSWVTGAPKVRHVKGTNLPVEQVSWGEAENYCKAIGGRLPTEAEWEYAARAGATCDRYGNLDEIAWYDGNSHLSTHEMGQKRPNAFGLYDMLGNVGQWVGDWYRWGTIAERSRVIRGGSWNDDPKHVRASYRYSGLPDDRKFTVGFRCAED